MGLVFKVWGLGSGVLGPGSSKPRTQAGRCSQRRSWCVIKADDDYTHLHAFFVPLQEANVETTWLLVMSGLVEWSVVEWIGVA